MEPLLSCRGASWTGHLTGISGPSTHRGPAFIHNFILISGQCLRCRRRIQVYEIPRGMTDGSGDVVRDSLLLHISTLA